MAQPLRSFALMLLCLALVASSATMAVARSQSAFLSQGSRTIVICTGYGVTSLAVDADGNPVGPVHPCPECLAGLAAHIAPGNALPLPFVQRISAAVSITAPALPRVSGIFSLRSRGPPELV